MRYTREDGCRAWLTHGLLQPDTLQRLLKEHGSAEALYDRFVAEKGAFLQEEITERQLFLLKDAAQPDSMHQLMVTMQRLHMGILSIEDIDYPDSLRSLSDPPVFLYYVGHTACLNEPRTLTMVGSRNCSPEGKSATRRIAEGLSSQGVVIVSGLAVGVDAAAHRGCLAGGSPTVAVVAGGLDGSYPAGNRALSEEIVDKGGAVLSEYPPGTPSLKGNFVVRNRIMSGLSRAVLLMEAQIKSGSMTTVTHALAQGREVFAYPGIPESSWSEGAHQLLREGARYFTSAGDVLEDMGWEGNPLPTKAEKAALPPLTPTQQAIMGLLRQRPHGMDELSAATGLGAAELGSALTLMQLLGLVQAQPGKTYALA